MFSAEPMQKRLQISGTLLIVGLVIEALCLLSKGPIAFVIFVAIGGLFIAVGVAVYLLSLVTHQG